MKNTRIVIAIFILFLPLLSIAQGTYTGCLLTSTNRVYTNRPIGDEHYTGLSGVVSLSSNYCYWQAGGLTSSCQVCVEGVQHTGPSGCTVGPGCQFTQCVNNNVQMGVEASYTMIQCPIDNSLILLSPVIAFIAFNLIRRRSLNILN